MAGGSVSPPPSSTPWYLPSWSFPLKPLSGGWWHCPGLGRNVEGRGWVWTPEFSSAPSCRGQSILSHSGRFPGQRCCGLQKPGVSAPTPLRQVRLQVAPRSGRVWGRARWGAGDWGRQMLCGVGGLGGPVCVGVRACIPEQALLLLPTAEPHFVQALEHGDHVYFFFREVSVEDARLGRVRSLGFLLDQKDPF